MVGNPLNTEVCESEKPADYDDDWTCGGPGEPECADGTKHSAEEVEEEETCGWWAWLFGMCSGLAQVEAESVFDDWDDCLPGMLC